MYKKSWTNIFSTASKKMSNKITKLTSNKNNRLSNTNKIIDYLIPKSLK